MKNVLHTKGIKTAAKGLATAGVIVGLTGCAAVGTAIEHRNLETQTKMSDSIFLQPVTDNQKTVYVEVKNTSAKPMDIQQQLTQAVRQRGYRVVHSIARAHYLLQVNVLKVGKFSQAAAEKALSNGFGGAFTGALAVAATDGTGESVIGGALIGGLVDTVANHLVKDNQFSVITDVQISERLAKGQVAKSQTTADITQGSSTQSLTRLTQVVHWMKYRTRVLSTADKVNLDFNEAAPLLRAQLAQSIAGIF